MLMMTMILHPNADSNIMLQMLMMEDSVAMESLFMITIMFQSNCDDSNDPIERNFGNEACDFL